MFSSLWNIGQNLLRMLVSTLLTDLPMNFDTEHQLRHDYDFVVVGAGSSGSVVAARLAEVPHWRILVLEAGGSAPPETAVPGLNLIALNGGFDWGYSLAPQPHAMFNYKGHSCPYPRGKGMGGTSSINTMTHVRGNSRDYDAWEDLGLDGWSYYDVLPYFKKSENYNGKLTTQNVDYHSFGGPLTVEAKSWGTSVQDSFIEAGRELGYPVNIDPNGPTQIGFSSLDLTTRRRVRSTSSESFLKPIAYKRNLDICTNAHVNKIVFDEYNRAVGVRFLHHGEEKEVFVSREVVLSAGAINTPQILMLSGVGPRNHLDKFKIPVVADVLGVGLNLQDHPSVRGLTWTVKRGSAQDPLSMGNIKVFTDYRFDKSGPLTVPFGLEGIAWASLGDFVDPAWPDLQFLVLSTHPAMDNGLRVADMMGFDRKVFGKYFFDLFSKEGVSIVPMLTRPASKGSVKLSSKDPTAAPIIDPNFLSDVEDVNSFIDGIKFALLLGNTTVFKEKLGAEFHNMPLPGCDDIKYGSDSYWSCYVRHMAGSSYNPAGTCKMAQYSDPFGVLSERLKVRGVTSVRVADASAMPNLPSGDLNAACVMIGEKAADIIKQDWGVVYS